MQVNFLFPNLNFQINKYKKDNLTENRQNSSGISFLGLPGADVLEKQANMKVKGVIDFLEKNKSFFLDNSNLLKTISEMQKPIKIFAAKINQPFVPDKKMQSFRNVMYEVIEPNGRISYARQLFDKLRNDIRNGGKGLKTAKDMPPQIVWHNLEKAEKLTNLNDEFYNFLDNTVKKFENKKNDTKDEIWLRYINYELIIANSMISKFVNTDIYIKRLQEAESLLESMNLSNKDIQNIFSKLDKRFQQIVSRNVSKYEKAI